MSLKKPPRSRGRNEYGEPADRTRFVEVEMPEVAASLVIELDGGGRILPPRGRGDMTATELVEGVFSADNAARLREGAFLRFGLGLRGPTLLVGREPQIPTRNHNYSVRHVRIVTCAPPRSPGLDPGFLHSLAIHHAE